MENNNEISKISFRLPADEKEELAKYAEENDLSISQVIRRAIKSYLKQLEDK